jgi:exopolysaccharide production protein ExoQ
MDIKTLALIPIGLILVSLLFFSRGILIFLTILCLELAAFPYAGVGEIALQLRWVFFFLFSLHTFGDIFLGRTVRKIKSFDILAISFIIYALFSIFYSPFPLLTLERSTTILILYISVFWIIWKYAYYRGPERVIQIILNVMWIVFLLSYLMIFAGPYRPFSSGRFTGIFINPNSMGVVSALILPLSLWHFLETKKFNSLFLFLMILLALLLSGARGSLNATAFALGYFLYARSRINKPLVFFFSMSLIFILVWAIETFGKQFFQDYIRVESIPILGGRLEIWPVVLDLIKDKPMFGYGFGVEDKIMAVRKVLPLHQGGYIHNSYLGILLQSGLFGFVIFFIPLFTLLFKELFSRQDSEGAPRLKYALRASLIAGLICSIYESWIYSVGNGQAFPFWIIVMLLVFYRYGDRKKVTPDST